MNKILFLYTDSSEKENLRLTSDAVRAVLRKFRKSSEILHFNVDLSLTCRNEVKKLLSEKLSDFSCIMFCGKKKTNNEEISLLKECFNIHSATYFSSGKCICSPVPVQSVRKKDDIIEEITVTDVAAIEKTVKLAINSATTKELLLCTDSEKEADRLIFRELENSIPDSRGLSVEHFDFDEMISDFLEKIPSYNVILTTDTNARIMAKHINSLNKFPAGYTILHGDNVRIYKKEALPYENLSNISYASNLLACAGMLENELGFKNAGVHLRKAVTRALEKSCFESKSDFQKHLLIEINTPIRHRQVKTNESNN